MNIVFIGEKKSQPVNVLDIIVSKSSTKYMVVMRDINYTLLNLDEGIIIPYVYSTIERMLECYFDGYEHYPHENVEITIKV